jgi:5-(carboxyamino)imidazole ribonucleotide synthase
MTLAFSSEQFVLGILGGGQLGRMLIQEAINLNINTAILDPDANAPCRHLTGSFVHGDFRDYDQVLAFGRKAGLLTVEIEHVNTKALLQLEAEGIPVYPQPRVLQMVQDKGLQKQFFLEKGIPTSEFVLTEHKNDLQKHAHLFPAVQKLRTSGYDGKGVQVLSDFNELSKAFDAPSVLERKVDFITEISVIVSRNHAGEVAHFPPVDMEFNPDANLVEFLCSPARIDTSIANEAIRIAREVIEKAQMVGLLAVEMFVTRSGEVLVNEVAPRPHNSGHQTIEGNVTSQYAQHLRAILGLPAGATDIIRPAVMINLLGEAGYQGEAKYDGIEEVLQMPGTYVHLYGKKITKPFRKMGHVTITAGTAEEAIRIARSVQKTLKVIA